MSTRSAVILRVHKEDLGKKVKFDESKLPVRLQSWKEEWGDDSDKEKSKEITLSNKYIGIYCHWDGYLDGVGGALKKNFNDYDTILNLIAGGFCSAIWYDCIKHYANRKGEEWEYIAPIQGKTMKEIKKSLGDNEYNYVFDDGWKANGKSF